MDGDGDGVWWVELGVDGVVDGGGGGVGCDGDGDEWHVGHVLIICLRVLCDLGWILLVCPFYATCVEMLFSAVMAVGAVARLTRLVVWDTILESFRTKCRGWLLTLVSCSWCASIWVSVPVAATWGLWGHCLWWQMICLALTASWCTGATGRAGLPKRHDVDVVAIPPIVVFPPDQGE